MRTRVVLVTLLFLLAGAIVNIAVAWGAALFVTLDDQARTRHDVFTDRKGTTAFPSYTVHRWQRAGALRVQVYRGDYSGRPSQNTADLEDLVPHWGAEFLHVPELDGPVDARHFDEQAWGDRAVDARGWPCLSLWGGVRTPFRSGQPDEWVTAWAHPLMPDPPSAPRHFASMRWLPMHPIWPGFAINTVFYAAILWLLLAAPFALRRRSRIKRGLCPACGYQVGTSPVCTECGKVVNE